MGFMHERSDQLLISLRRIIRAIDLHSKKLLQTFGLTGPQLLLLKAAARLLVYQSDLTARELADEVSLSQATITSILDRICERGYMTRCKSEKDKRKTLLQLTQKAHDILDQRPMLLQEQFLLQFEALPDWQQMQLMASVDQLAAMMQAQKLDAGPVLANDDLV